MLFLPGLKRFAREREQFRPILKQLTTFLDSQYHNDIADNMVNCSRCVEEIEICTDGQRTIHDHANTMHGYTDELFLCPTCRTLLFGLPDVFQHLNHRGTADEAQFKPVVQFALPAPSEILRGGRQRATPRAGKRAETRARSIADVQDLSLTLRWGRDYQYLCNLPVSTDGGMLVASLLGVAIANLGLRKAGKLPSQFRERKWANRAYQLERRWEKQMSISGTTIKTVKDLRRWSGHFGIEDIMTCAYEAFQWMMEHQIRGLMACSLCDRRFSGNLYHAHMTQVHDLAPQDGYSCFVHNLFFPDVEMLLQHMELHE